MAKTPLPRIVVQPGPGQALDQLPSMEGKPKRNPQRHGAEGNEPTRPTPSGSGQARSYEDTFGRAPKADS
jgi:hypothetical protein